MRTVTMSRELAYAPWQAETVPDRRSAHAMRIIELANTLAAAETAVLTGDDAKAMADLRRLQADTLAMLAALETPCPAEA